MAQVLMISIFGQFSGNGLGYFNTVIYTNLGVVGVPRQLGYNLINAVVSAISALTGAFLTDRMPRRKILVIGTFSKSSILPSYRIPSDSNCTSLVSACLLGINSGLSALLAKEGTNVKKSVAQGALTA